MTEHRRNLLVMDCMEANVYYNGANHYASSNSYADMLIAEAYLMRAESLTGNDYLH